MLNLENWVLGSFLKLRSYLPSILMDNKKNKSVLHFLLSRRSNSARTLVKPSPDKPSIQKILTAAARTPDHGKLVPWRFLVLENMVMPKIASKILEVGVSRGVDPDKLRKSADTFLNAPLIVTVVSSPNSNHRIPVIEQQLSAGAVCVGLLNAAQAEGWGANWLTGWMAHDRLFLSEALCLCKTELVAGFIHIGTKTSEPFERERPDINNITSWLEL